MRYTLQMTIFSRENDDKPWDFPQDRAGSTVKTPPIMAQTEMRKCENGTSCIARDGNNHGGLENYPPVIKHSNGKSSIHIGFNGIEWEKHL
jgi:hypothetical protein